MNPNLSLPLCFAFGRCEVFLPRRQLKIEGRVIPLGGRAYDLLITLAAARGRVVGKSELMGELWPGREVEENTLEGQISILRRALEGDRSAVRTVAGHGYQFVAETLELIPSIPDPARGVVLLPFTPTPLVGRDTAVSETVDLVATRRLVTLTGPGGVGKTRLAIECARNLAARFPDRVAIAELASVGSEAFVSMAIATALGNLPADGQVLLDRVASVLHGKRILLIVDNCEHLIAETARVVETILEAAPLLHVIATSRETLGIEGEYVYPVGPLELPDHEEPSTDRILQTGAVRFFYERASSAGEPLPDDSTTVRTVARICAQLDGLPLALQLAAAPLSVLGLSGVVARLGDGFPLQTGTRTTGVERHQTLEAALDWSFELLDDAQRAAFTQLSVFAGRFSFEAAEVLLATNDAPSQNLVANLESLIAKSLLHVDVSMGQATYSMLETTRAYGREKLSRIDSTSACARRHAEYVCRLFEGLEHRWESEDAKDVERIGLDGLADMRAASTWSFSQAGDPAIGIRLITAAVPFLMYVSHVGECLASVKQALQVVKERGVVDPERVTKLQTARGLALLYSGGGPETAAILRQALEQALATGNAECQSKAIWGLWELAQRNGPYETALDVAVQFAHAPQAAATRLAVSNRMLGISWLRLGQLQKSRTHLQSMRTEQQDDNGSTSFRLLYDQQAAGDAALATLQWHQGFPEMALDSMNRAIQRAREIDHPASVWYVLTTCACPLLLATHGIGAIESPTAATLDTLCRYGMSTWKAQARAWQGLLLFAHDDHDAYDRVIAPLFREHADVRLAAHMTAFLSSVCHLLAIKGRTTEAVALNAAALNHARRTGDASSLPELIRVDGELTLLTSDSRSERTAEARFTQAQALSREAGLLSWELRAVTSFGRLRIRQGRSGEAHELVELVYRQFTEGFETLDLQAARDLMTKTTEDARQSALPS